MNCPSSHELSRAMSDGADANVEAHLAACPACTKEWNATRDMIDLARQFTAPLPPASRREEVRTLLLAASRAQSLTDFPDEPRRGSKRLVVSIGAALAIAAGFALFLRSRPSATPGHHGTITALTGAQYFEVAPSPDERVMLTEGSIDVQVTPLHPGERFRVMLGDAEVEVHGTRFIATAEHGSLVGVVVDHGIVEVRPHVGAMRMLHAGEAWHPTLTAMASPAPAVDVPPVVNDVAKPPATAPEPKLATATPKLTAESTPKSQRAQKVEPPVADATPPVADATPAVADATPQERAYDAGWTAMRTGKFDDAATAFRKVLLLDPNGALSEDATYWNAVALARSKQSARAIAAFRDFLDQYSHAKRAGEASAMLGWLLVSAGNRDEAVRRFKTAVDDPDEAVRTSARAGLDALTIK